MSASDRSSIDAPRFWSTVMRSGEIGPGKAGGLRRLALTDADKEMRDLFVTWCTEAGCTVTVDRVGNIFARPPGHRRSPAAGADGQPSRHPVRGRQVRRHRRRAGRPRGAAHARRPPRAHQAPARAGVLDQRGGRALHAADGGLGRLRGRLRRGLGARPARRRRQAVRRRARAHRLQRQDRGGRPRASTPTSSCTSSRGRSSTARRCRSASWWAATRRAACTWTSTARPRTPARPRWTGGATPWWARPCWRWRSTRSAGSTTPPRARPRWPAWSPGPTRRASSPSTPSSPATCATPSARWPTRCWRR